MAPPFAIYARVSDVGDRDGESFGSPEEQEAAGRAWAERAAVEVLPDPVVELNVSGAVPVNERELGRLIRECERGELAGIIVRYEDRFARDLIEGALALQRLDACGARLVATATGFDSANLNSQSRLAFNLMMSVAQAQRERNREAYLAGAQRAARRGAYLAGRPPLGYSRDEQGRIAPVPEAKKLIREAFKRRARGETLRAIRDYLRAEGARSRRGTAGRAEENAMLRPFAELTEQGVRHLLRQPRVPG